LFVDPIADIAVLGEPDNQTFPERAEAYEELTEAATPLTIAEPPSEPITEEVAELAEAEKQMAELAANLAKVKGEDNLASPRLVRWARRECPALLLSLSNQWFPCKVRHYPNGTLSIHDAADGIVGGMSGSPIIAKNGTAIGIVCLGSGLERGTEGGNNPRLMGNLPGWFLKALSPERG
jgi:hypothetical protein